MTKRFYIGDVGPSEAKDQNRCLVVRLVWCLVLLGICIIHMRTTSPSILCGGDSTPAPMTCFPLTNPRKCCPAPHGPGCAFAEGGVLPTRRVGRAAIRIERRAAKQNKRPLQQAQRIVRLPGWCRGQTCAHVHSSQPGSTKLGDERSQTHTEPASFGYGVSSCLPLFVPGCFCAQRRVTLDMRTPFWVLVLAEALLNPHASVVPRPGPLPGES